MRIGLIGCGRVGVTLFSLLRKNNHIVGVYDINKRNEKRALQLLHLRKNQKLSELCRNSEALFFATPDDQVLKAFMRAKPYVKGRKYLFHFSGLLPASIFPRGKNVYRGSIHPFATFPTIMIAPQKKYFLFTEGDREAKRAARGIFGTKYFTIRNIATKRKALYHLIGVFASNLLIGLLFAVHTLTKRIGWKERDFYKVVFSIIEETLGNAKKNQLKNTLSGPLKRGDIEVIKKHVSTLSKEKDLLNIYKVVSLYVLKNIPTGKKGKEIEFLLKKI